MSFEELDENLFRIEVPLPENPLRALNVYLLRADAAHPGWRGRSLLIDNGFNRSECRDVLLAALCTLGVAMNSLDFFVTHLHADHCGLTSLLLDMAGKDAWVFASPGDMVRINMLSRQSFRQRESFGDMLRTGMPDTLFEYMLTGHPGIHFATDGPCPFTPIREGDVLDYSGYRLRVLEMPGHTPDLLCLYDKERQMLFSSDHILADISPNITHWDGVRDSLGNYLRSLAKAKKLDVRLCLPGHRTLFADCRGRITALEQHHAARLSELHDILDREGPCGAYAVAAHMKWSIREKCWEDFPPAQKWFACGEAMAHLEHLYAHGKIRRIRRAGQTLYTLSSSGAFS